LSINVTSTPSTHSGRQDISEIEAYRALRKIEPNVEETNETHALIISAARDELLTLRQGVQIYKKLHRLSVTYNHLYHARDFFVVIEQGVKSDSIKWEEGVKAYGAINRACRHMEANTWWRDMSEMLAYLIDLKSEKEISLSLLTEKFVQLLKAEDHFHEAFNTFQDIERDARYKGGGMAHQWNRCLLTFATS